MSDPIPAGSPPAGRPLGLPPCAERAPYPRWLDIERDRMLAEAPPLSSL